MESSSIRWYIPALLLASIALYAGLLYATPRTDFLSLIGHYSLLFLLYATVLFLGKKESSAKKRPFYRQAFGQFILAGVLFRLLAFFALPEMSDDYFRFVWDGRLLAHGLNPFLQLPSDIPEAAYADLGLSTEIFTRLNSPDYFTIYPPVCQAIFLLSARLFPQDIYLAVLSMKVFFLLAELGSIALLLKLLQRWGLPLYYIGLYALNPLVIVELTGNLHFEALMIFFLLGSLYLLEKGKWLASTFPFALAVCSKLIPLIFLPFLIRRLGWGKAFLYGVMVGMLSVLAFAPVFDEETFLHLFGSVSLYFQSFEFNASIYYLVRALGFQFTGYNIIQYAGPALAGLTVLGVLLLALKEKNTSWSHLPESMLFALLVYLALATTVHPWYVTSLIAMASLGSWRFPILWSALLPLTYIAYQHAVYAENLYLIGIEYGILMGYLIYELRKKEKISDLPRQISPKK